MKSHIIRKGILIIRANPPSTTPLRVDKEEREIEEGLRETDIDVYIADAARPRDIHRKLLKHKPQIVHFCGHGDANGMVLEGDEGNPIIVDPQALADLFSILSSKIECVILNACYSDVAAKLISKYVAFVVGMNKKVADPASVAFAAGFYTGIGAGESIEDSYLLGCNRVRIQYPKAQFTPSLEKQPLNRFEWGAAPEAIRFVDRASELEQLKQWINKDYVRVILLFGLGGIGKTVFATHLARSVAEYFDYVIWQPLINAPTPDKVFSKCIEFFSNYADTSYPKGDPDEQVSALLQYLESYRCLVILDNAESVLSEEYSDSPDHGSVIYSKLLVAVAERKHKSCVLITSAEKPVEIAEREDRSGPVRSKEMQGLDTDSVRDLLSGKNLNASEETWKILAKAYSGNPLLLNVAAAQIKGAYNGNVKEFLEAHDTVREGSHDIIQEEIERLSPLELSLLRWLALRSPRSIDEIKDLLFINASHDRTIETLNKLQWRALVESTAEGFDLQNLVLERVRYGLIQSACNAIIKGNWKGLKAYALLEADSPEYVRILQNKNIVSPILHRLQQTLHGEKAVAATLEKLISDMRVAELLSQGYAVGNVVNLLIALGHQFDNINLSGLAIHQAYFADTRLTNVDFSRSELSQSAFRETIDISLSCAFHPAGDSFATGDVAGNISIWSTKPLRKLKIIHAHDTSVSDLRYSRDGRFLGSCSHDGRLRIWDRDNNSYTCNDFVDSPTWLTCLDFSPNEKQVVGAGGDGAIRLWHIKNNTCQILTSENCGTYHALRIAPSGRFLLAGDSLGILQMIILHQENMDESLLFTHSAHTGQIGAIAFHPEDDSTFATGGEDGRIVIWISSPEAPLKPIYEFQAHQGLVTGITFSTNGTLLISSSHDQTIKVWECRDPFNCLEASTLRGHEDKIHAIGLATDDRTLVSCSDDVCLRVWDIFKAKCVGKVIGYSGWVSSLTLYDNGSKLVAGSADTTVKIWYHGDQQSCSVLNGHLDRVNPVAISIDEKIIASGANNGEIILWDANTRVPLQKLTGHQRGIRGLAFLIGEYRLVSAAYDQTVRLWEVDHHGVVKSEILSEKFPNWLGAIDVNQDKSLLAFTLHSGRIQIFDLINRSMGPTLETDTDQLQTLVFSPDDTLLAAAGNDGIIHIWNKLSWKKLPPIKAHSVAIGALAFSPDSKVLASAGGGGEGRLKLWDVASGDSKATVHASDRSLHAVIFSKNGTEVISAGSDGTISFWDAQELRLQNVIINPRPYEGLRIASVSGLTDAQIMTLQMLGACTDKNNHDAK